MIHVVLWHILTEPPLSFLNIDTMMYKHLCLFTAESRLSIRWRRVCFSDISLPAWGWKFILERVRCVRYTWDSFTKKLSSVWNWFVGGLTKIPAPGMNYSFCAATDEVVKLKLKWIWVMMMCCVWQWWVGGCDVKIRPTKKWQQTAWGGKNDKYIFRQFCSWLTTILSELFWSISHVVFLFV